MKIEKVLMTKVLIIMITGFSWIGWEIGRWRSNGNVERSCRRRRGKSHTRTFRYCYEENLSILTPSPIDYRIPFINIDLINLISLPIPLPFFIPFLDRSIPSSLMVFSLFPFHCPLYPFLPIPPSLVCSSFYSHSFRWRDVYIINEWIGGSLLVSSPFLSPPSSQSPF